jgi:hypothetical protein
MWRLSGNFTKAARCSHTDSSLRPALAGFFIFTHQPPLRGFLHFRSPLNMNQLKEAAWQP